VQQDFSSPSQIISLSKNIRENYNPNSLLHRGDQVKPKLLMLIVFIDCWNMLKSSEGTSARRRKAI
jgi:hypothetical protein